MITQTTLSDRVISQKIGTSAELNDAYKTIENLKEDIVELNTTIDDLEQDIESINQGYIDRDNELMVIINDINNLL